MAKRKIIKIDETKCNGCGLCIPNCPEGALQIIDAKVRLISDLFCDGLGACIGHCPEGAISIEERDAEPYSERRVMENIIKQGRNVIRAHLAHLAEHNETTYLKEARALLRERGIDDLLDGKGKDTHSNMHSFSGCPGSKAVDFNKAEMGDEAPIAKIQSQLRQWPIQLHLINPAASYYQGADVLLVADCVAYALGSFHADYLKGKSIAIACPKLDEGQEIYAEKIKSWFDDAKIKSLTVIIMQVPCCMGLVNLATQAKDSSKSNIPAKYVVVGLQGEIISEKEF